MILAQCLGNDSNPKIERTGSDIMPLSEFETAIIKRTSLKLPNGGDTHIRPYGKDFLASPPGYPLAVFWDAWTR